MGSRNMSLRDTFIERDVLMNILMWIEDFNGEVPVPAILKPKPLWTGKQLFSLIMPKVNRRGICSGHPDDDKAQNFNKEIPHTDTGFLVEVGVVDKYARTFCCLQTMCRTGSWSWVFVIRTL